jgi:hypothetical protein
MKEIKKLLFLYRTGTISKDQYNKSILKLKKRLYEKRDERILLEDSNVQSTITPQLHPLVYMHQVQKHNNIMMDHYIKQQKKEYKDRNLLLSSETELSKEEQEEIKQQRKIRVKYLGSILKNDKAVRYEQAIFTKELLQLPPENRLKKLHELPTIKTFKAEHNHSDKVSLIDGFIVRKEVEKTGMGNYMFWNEVNSLKKLLSYNHFPKLLAYDSYNLIIYMSYCGDMITSKNLPVNWRQQLGTIQKYLYEADVNSNDMILRNTCVLDGRINIIDFGLNTEFKKDVAYSISNLYNRMSSIEFKKAKNNKNQ